MNCCHVNRLAAFTVLFVSRFFRALGWRACRFYPSCSAYSYEAFGRLGFWKSVKLSARRVSRCHPLHAGGYDPLPQDNS